MLKTLALTLTLLLSFTVAACSSTSGTSAKIDQTTANAAQTAPTNAVQRVRLTLANQDELIVKLNGTRAAEDFLSLLPLELTCKDFNNTEKVAYLPRRLDTQGAPAGFDPQTGSFAYYAPWGNLAQGIINASKNIIHTSKTATNMVSNFQETVKIYQQGKKYYDALKSVNNLVKDARKVQQTILMVGDITDIYVNSFQRMLRDGNFRPEELSAIAFGYTKLLEESNEVLTELKNVVNITTLSMTDKERMDVVERCYSKMKRYRNLVSYYTNKNISVSYLRAKKKNDLDRIMGLYGNMNERYW